MLWLPLLPLPPSSNPKSGSRASLAQRRRRYLCHYLWVAGVGHDCTDNPPPPGAALPPPSSAGISLLAALPPPLPIGPPGAPQLPLRLAHTASLFGADGPQRASGLGLLAGSRRRRSGRVGLSFPGIAASPAPRVANDDNGHAPPPPPLVG